MQLAQMPGKNPLFPQLLNRKSYFIRWMICFAITVLIFVLYIAEIFPKEAAQAWLVAGGLYGLFGLHIPRLKDAGIVPLAPVAFPRPGCRFGLTGNHVCEAIETRSASAATTARIGDTSRPRSFCERGTFFRSVQRTVQSKAVASRIRVAAPTICRVVARKQGP